MTTPLSEDHILDWKSTPDNFRDEMEGIKNNTVRFYEANDPQKRFERMDRAIEKYRATGEFPPLWTRIRCTDSLESFTRKVRHICKYKNAYIITWTP